MYLKLNSTVHSASIDNYFSNHLRLIVINYLNNVLLRNINLTCDNCYDFKILFFF